MRTTSFKNIILLIGFAGLLFSCSTPQHFQRENVNTEGLFTSTTDSVSMANTPWQQLFTSPYLQQLIQTGLDNNPDLQIAVQKVLEAEAYLSQSKAAFLPSLAIAANGTYSRNSESTYPSSSRRVHAMDLKMSTSWEADIWGKLKGEKRAAYANLLYSDAGKKAVQTRLIADIATTYYNLMSLDAQLKITQQSLANNVDLVKTMKALKQSGTVTGAAVVQSEANRYAVEVTIPDLKQQIQETQNTLCLLLGKIPGQIERDKLENQALSPILQTGVPSLLLQNRPDVMQAEYAVISAFETTNSARAYFYPALTITASGGFESINFDELFDPGSIAFNLLGGLTQPIFNKRANATRLKVAKAKQEEALLGFRNQLLNAGREIQNALASYQSATEKTGLRKHQLDALNKSVDYTKELLIYGSANYTEVLTAQQSLLAAQLNNVNDKLQQLNAVVSLYRALGGGWQ